MAKITKKPSASKEQSKEALAKAKYAAAKAAKRAARSVSPVAGVNEGTSAQPIPAVATKPKRVRYVREVKPVQSRAASSVLPPRSGTFSARLMSKGMALPPKDERGLAMKMMG